MTTTEPTAQQILALPMQQPNDADAETVRDYLVVLLATLWTEQEGFSGKRPLGNSGWEFDLYLPLIEAGYVEGTFDDGDIDDCDDAAADKLIHTAILALGKPSEGA